ncbi:MAG: repeat containing protein [Bryobacterales bacterium]|nr:repeat containing protein [Bryobacterales bacterium]
MKICIVASIAWFAPMIWAQPVITPGGILNVSGAQPRLAPNAVFVVYGQNLGPATEVDATAPNYPISLGGSSVSFTPTAGGSAVSAYMVFTLAAAVGGVIPSSLVPGTYAVRVTYNGQTSTPQTVTVVSRLFNIATANGIGSGTAQATIVEVNEGFSLTRFTTAPAPAGPRQFAKAPAHGTNTISLWGTGGGADAANDTGGSSGDQTAAGSFKVMVGSRVITPTYTGAVAGYPGLWVLIFTLPADIEPDCYASLQVSSNGELSNTPILPIAAAGESACADPNLTPAVLTKLDGGGTIVGGALAVVRSVSTNPAVTQEFGSGSFARWTAAKWAASAPSRPNLGHCSVFERTYPVGGTDPAGPEALLDAGASLPLSGPGLPQGASLARIVVPTFGFSYLFSPALGTFRTGRYTLTGNGGADVGPFNAGANFPASFAVTNWDSITVIDRSRPVNLTWTGSGADYVTVVITNSRRESSIIHIVTISCYVRGSDGALSVPLSAVSRLLPPPADATMSVQGYSFEIFNANLVAGGQIDFGSFGAALSVSKTLSVQ